MDITTGFEPVIGGSSPSEGTFNSNYFLLMKMKVFTAFLFLSLLMPVFLFLPTTQVKAVACDSLLTEAVPGTEAERELVHPDTQGSLVPCGQYPDCRCDLADFFTMGLRIYNFLTWIIIVPLAALMIVIGGLLILLSGGPNSPDPVTKAISPNLYSLGKQMVLWSIISVILVFGAWLIVDVLLKTIGYTGNWSSF